MQTQQQAVLSSQPSTVTNECSSGNYFAKAKEWFSGAGEKGQEAWEKFTGLFQGGNDPSRARQRMRMQMRMMRGGTARPYHNLTNLAAHGAPIYGIHSAAPHQWTRGGGRYRKRKCNKKTKRCCSRKGKKRHRSTRRFMRY
jgi:hypothetical protein